MTLIKIFIGALLISYLITLYGWVYSYIYSHKLYSYLKQNNYDRWRELTSVGRYGPGLSNPIRGFKYIYSDQDNENERVLRLKDSIKIGFRHFIIGLLSMLVNFAILVFIGWKIC